MTKVKILKPCPFCGKGVEWNAGAIVCNRCGLTFRPPGSKERVDNLWNSRATDKRD